MKLKAVISNTAPQEFFQAFSNEVFARQFLERVVEVQLGVRNAVKNPAAFYVQEPDSTIGVGDAIGVELRLTGVSRYGRTASQFHKALLELQSLVKEALLDIMWRVEVERVQIFCVLMLDGDVETSPGSGIYSNVLETEPVWVTRENA